LTPVSAFNTLSCQWETLHPKLLRSKNPIDSDHGIYREQRWGTSGRSRHVLNAPLATVGSKEAACR
jgi:hypothetical protein